jgi:hypothetical protein
VGLRVRDLEQNNAELGGGAVTRAWGLLKTLLRRLSGGAFFVGDAKRKGLGSSESSDGGANLAVHNNCTLT